jgi:hypothetical protein
MYFFEHNKLGIFMNRFRCKIWLFFVTTWLIAASVHAYDTPAIFACLTGPNYECLNREIGRNQEWYKLKDQKNKTPLTIALSKRNIPLIIYLLDKGALTRSRDVIFAMKIFFKIPKEDLLAKNINASAFDTNLSRRLILGAQASDKKVENMVKIAQVLNFFCEREAVALAIAELFSEKKISNVELQILLYELKDLFLQDELLTNEQIKVIVSALLPLPAPHLLLRMVVAMAQNSRPAHHRLLSCNLRNQPLLMVQELSQAIIENSRLRFLKIPPSALERYVWQKDKDLQVQAAINTTNALSAFVLLSIKLCTEEEEIQRRYLFWFAVYGILTQEGDFMGAFAVASSLNAPETQRKLRSKIYKEIGLVCPDKNYKNYRDAIAKYENKFYIPALVVHLHDLDMARNYSLFRSVEDREEIDEGLLEFYVHFNAEIGRVYLKAFKQKYSYKDNLLELVENFPVILAEPHPDNEKLQEALNILWPKLSMRRRSGTFF